jgi:methylmalonyl-CoA mutase, N-terminal domain
MRRMDDDRSAPEGPPEGPAAPGPRYARWLRETYAPLLRERGERDALFRTLSDIEVAPLYTAEHLEGWDPEERLGYPGEYPYTRGVHASGYRGKLWTMRMFAGFGTPEETNARFKALLDAGQTGLSTAFDLPTLMGYDSDHPIRSRRGGEVRRGGLQPRRHGGAVRRHRSRGRHHVDDHQQPRQRHLGDVPRDGRAAGGRPAPVGGTIQNDILKEFIAQKEYIFPPAPSVQLVIDTFEWGPSAVPRWNVVSVSGYHIREAGSTAVQELAFTLADGIHYVRRASNAASTSTPSRRG